MIAESHMRLKRLKQRHSSPNIGLQRRRWSARAAASSFRIVCLLLLAMRLKDTKNSASNGFAERSIL